MMVNVGSYTFFYFMYTFCVLSYMGWICWITLTHDYSDITKWHYIALAGFGLLFIFAPIIAILL